jgi:UDP-N-acetylmuramate dehydrogenase
MNLQPNVLLKNYTTFKIGGPAEYFTEVDNLPELKEVLQWAKDNHKPTFMLGSGSNVLISDQGLKGLVVKLKFDKLEFKDANVIVGASVILAHLLNKSLDHDLIGLEFATGIPGTVGGAIRGNAGTYGLAMSDVLVSVKYLDANLDIKTIFADECNFAYRHSIFKDKQQAILEAELKLSKGDSRAARQLVEERLQYRQATQPTEPSAGCIFKNIPFQGLDLEALRSKGVEIDKFTKFQKIPAGYLIEEAGLKGKTIGQAHVSTKHSNYIVNKGQATAEQVIMLISFIKQQIRDKYGLQLQEEVQIMV